LLRNAELIEACESLFELFRLFLIHNMGSNRQDGAVLGPDEEALLETIVTQIGQENLQVARLHGVFAGASIYIRLLSEIPRSGHD
jgi:hypothetical protein